MKINFSNLFSKGNGQDAASQAQQDDELLQEAEAMAIEEEEISAGTKIKVIAAFIIVGFATYVAYWVQEPTDIQADLLGSQETQMEMVALESETQAEATASSETMVESTEENTVALEEESGFTQEISIHDFAFSPATITVEKGTTVIWTNTDSVPHTVTGPNFSSNTLNSGDSFTKVFAEDETISYHCSFHPQMQGTLTVGEGSAEVALQTEGVTEELRPAAVEADPEMAMNTEAMAMEDQVLDAEVVAAEAFPYETPTETLNVEPLVNVQPEIHSAAYNNYEDDARLSQSGPEDTVYVAIFGVVLYLNRKKFLSAHQ